MLIAEWIRKMWNPPPAADPRVQHALTELRCATSDMKDALRPYKDSKDPITALLTDILNERSIHRNGTGTH